MAGKETSKGKRIVFGFLEKGMRRLQVRAFQVLSVETPVDTGFLRAGWSPTIGAPDRSTPTLPKGANVKGIGEKAKRDLAQAQAQALFAKHSEASNALGKGYKIEQGTIFITNNVRYGRYVNDGTSAQAPKMFVEKALNIAVQATRQEFNV